MQENAFNFKIKIGKVIFTVFTSHYKVKGCKTRRVLGAHLVYPFIL